ncbi:MAG TPA: DUF4424 family protein [Methylomirabilota bacterium]|nr:DUF4424 family protein [Methylomirabilota bacterium]
MSYPVSRKFGLLYRSLVVLSLLLLMGGFDSILFADPGAAGFALGGLQFRKEPRIAMVKEYLTIAADWEDGPVFESTITADYEFLNRTNQDVAIRMAFPVPDAVCWAANDPYTIFTGGSAGQPGTAIHVWVQGKEINYSTEARAFRSSENTAPSGRGEDYTKLLEGLGVAPLGCGRSSDFSEAAKRTLLPLGLLDQETNDANWTWRVKYHWMQKFPGKKTTHIKITYPAMAGTSEVYLGEGWDKRVVQATDSFWDSELRHTCGGPQLAGGVQAEMSRPDSYISVAWVDFILLTANYWNGPIEDFILTVNVPDFGDRATHVSFCWDGPTRRVDSTHVVATAHNFSPKRDLHIGFFQVVN